MKKRAVSLLLMLVMVLSLVPTAAFAVEVVASGDCGADGSNLMWTLDDEGTLTISGTGAMKDYDYYSSVPWHSYCSNIKSVTIPSGVTSIGDWAFYMCYNLTSMTIPNSVTSIGYSAFYNCRNLASVTIPDSVTSIGESAFCGCSSLTSVTIGNDVTWIGTYVFRACTSLTSITVNSNNTAYCSQNGVLYNKAKTVLLCYPAGKANSSFSIPNSVTSIGEEAFAECYGLTSVTIPNSVTSIGEFTFAGCHSLTSITIPDSVTSIGASAFRGSSLPSITIPNSVTSISGWMFYDCDSLTSITIPNSVTSIGMYAFGSCSCLTSVAIPNSVTSISDSAFNNCDKLTIYGYANSYAQTYATEKNVPFVVLDDEEKERGTGFNLKENGHCVVNSDFCFGYDSWTNWYGILGYKIPLERYQEVYGKSYTKHIYDQDISVWGGNCFGMSTTAALFYKGKLQVQNYTHDVGTLTAGGYDDMVTSGGTAYLRLNKNSELTKLIERYQIWQESTEFLKSGIKDIFNYGLGENANVFSTIVNNVKSTKEPYLVLVHWKDSDNKTKGHALVVDSSRMPRDLGNGWFRLYLYDPNNPYFEYFGSKTPLSCYNQAENRFLDVNVKNGRWKMAAQVNGSGTSKTSIGYDGENLLRESTLLFVDVNDYPTNFDKKATFSSTDNSTKISYSSDNFEVRDIQNKLVYKMVDGSITYKDDEIVTVFNPYGYIEGINTGVSEGSLILPKGTYTVSMDNGAVAYMEDGNYAGIVTKDAVTVSNAESTALTIDSDSNADVNIVLADISSSEEFSSIESDVKIGDSGLEISLVDTNLNIRTDEEQKIEVNTMTEDGEKNISAEISENTTDIDVSVEHEIEIHTHSGGTATCTEKAKCSTCGEEYGSLADHYYSIKVTEPTCTEQGYTTHTCICGDSYVDSYIDATGHKWDAGNIVNAATCDKDGTVSYTCTVCRAVDTKTLPAKGHVIVTDAAVTATYTKSGKTAGSHCYVCGKVLTAQKTVAMKVPAQVKISSVSNTSTGITVKWGKITGATHYQVYRKVGSGEWKLWKTTTSTSVSNTGLTSGSKYQYKVRAVVKNSAGTVINKGSFSAIKTKYFVVQPKIASIVNTKDGITVKWNKVTGATAYKVYRKVGSGAWKIWKTTTSTSVSNTGLTNGTKYQYKIVAVKKVSSTATYQSVASAIKTMHRLTRPTLASGTKNIATRRIVVKWNKNTKATGYQIKYVKGTTTKTVKVRGEASLSKTLSSLTKGATYKVYVRSYKTVGSSTYYSAYSSYKSIKVSR